MFKSLKLGFLKKFNYNFNPILQNRFVLYFFFFLAFIELLYFLNIGDAMATVVLLLVGFLTSFFSKNMIVVILISLVVTNLIKFGIKRTMEGMEGNNESDTDKKNESQEDEKEKEKKEKEEKEKEEKDTKSPDNKPTVDENYENLQKEYPQFKVVQQEILDGVKKMAPLLDKAEKFIDKFDKYKKRKANIQ
jgi:hypothetical protein